MSLFITIIYIYIHFIATINSYGLIKPLLCAVLIYICGAKLIKTIKVQSHDCDGNELNEIKELSQYRRSNFWHLYAV